MNEIKYSKLSSNEIPLLLNAIENVLIETEAHDLTGSKNSTWKWQYEDLPTSKSHIFIAKKDSEIIGYYHIPTYEIKINNESFKIGHIQSVAILNAYRGKGIFKELADFANKEVDNHLDIIYTFPNKKSIHTFTEYNQFKLIAPLPVYLLPLDISQLLASRYKIPKILESMFSIFNLAFQILKKKLNQDEKLIELFEIDQQVEDFFIEFGNKSTFRLLRNKQYLKWRYLDSPKGEHKIVCLKHKNLIKAITVIKKEEIFSSTGLVIMDIAYENKKYLQKLITNLPNKDLFNTNNSETFIFASGLDKNIKSLKNCGFIPIPQKAVPRQLNLLARWTNSSINKTLTDRSSWLITLGDWDVF